MKKQTLTASVRTERRKGAAGRLRRSGKIPAILYGQSDPTPIAIDGHEFGTKFHNVSESSIIQLNIDDTSREVLIKDYQQDIITGNVEHIDFYEFEQGKPLRTNVPVHFIGSAQGVREGGLLDTSLHELDVECLPADIPDAIEVDVSDLAVGDSVHVGDLTAPQGVTIHTSPDYVVVSVTVARITEEAAEEAVEEGAEEELEEGAAEATAAAESEE
jgi:large subunit ribosomal protein L25